MTMSIFLRTIVLLYSISRILSTFASSPEDQSNILLEFKNEFKIQKPCEFLDPKTKSWANKSEYCNWRGVTCDTKSDKVIGLDLSCSCLHGRFKPNSSLFRLQHLQSLNLAYNSFLNSTIPAKFNKLVGLERLNLSESSFSGQIPTEIVQLTNLVSLDLSSFSSSSSSFDIPSNLSIEEPSFLRLLALNLRNLREVDMSSVNISSEIPNEFSKMLSLRSLTLENCNLLGRFSSNVFLIPSLQLIDLSANPQLRGQLPDFHGKEYSLQRISLGRTSFSGTIPDSIGNLKHLLSLKLSESAFSGSIPSSLGNLSHLSFLHLRSNNFIGEIPSSIGNLKQLTVFDVFSNKLSGNFPSALLNLTKLRTLDLCLNQFSGSLPPNISQLSNLNIFSLFGNSFVGPIPASLFKISSLTHILLNENQFSDLLGIENISLSPNLESLFLGYNNYSVNVSPPVDLNLLSPLKQLSGLSLSGIPLSTTNITSGFSSNLRVLYLSDCNITEFPQFIRNNPNLFRLDLSNNKMESQVPDWLWRLPKLETVNLASNSFSGFNGSFHENHHKSIFDLDLSSNAFQGPLFIPSSSIQYLFASKNNFTGELPSSICGSIISPHIIDLSNNNFCGSIPWCLGAHMTSLKVLNLQNNSLNGTLPDIFINAAELTSLDLSHNLLEGKIPASLNGCSALEVLNLENNKIKDTFPFHLSSLQKLQVIVLRSNNFHGKLHRSDSDGTVWSGFPQLKILDVSHNDLLGTLPSDYFLNWTGISSKSKTDNNSTKPDYIGGFGSNDGIYGYYSSIILRSKGVSMDMERILKVYTAIDFSGNQLHGKIPESVGLLKELRILNLSSNAFMGHIPSSLANLTVLESLDLSQNKLSGEIPPELGKLSSLGWINVSHNELVGSIPQGTQFQRQKCSSYEGNPGLLGLKNVCGSRIETTSQQSEQPELVQDDDDEEEGWLSWIWMAAGIGFAPGVVFGITIGYIVASYKIEWFTKIFGRTTTC